MSKSVNLLPESSLYSIDQAELVSAYINLKNLYVLKMQQYDASLRMLNRKFEDISYSVTEDYAFHLSRIGNLIDLSMQIANDLSALNIGIEHYVADLSTNSSTSGSINNSGLLSKLKSLSILVSKMSNRHYDSMVRESIVNPNIVPGSLPDIDSAIE